ncbi:iron-sulfur cluster assembly accessory protein [Dissophora ornata]|nr:[4Fe-4S] proteins maturation [Dissophora ornata]KAI8605817.1 iron-sulfur cluster assembly accessory protein [Dissophora ornata]
MASCLKYTSLFPRTSLRVRSHTYAAPTTAFLTSRLSKATSTRVRLGSCAALHILSTPSQRQLVSSSYPTGQRWFNSVAAVDTLASDSASPHTPLKIHNPQLDESGKELTIDITDNAVKQLKHIAARDQNPLQALRITVDSGGCHGYQYLMDLTDVVNEDDVVFDKGGARVVIDTITLPMISGSRIDFIEELIGSAFKVLANPHAAHSCGCDTSFEIKI